MNAFDLWKQQMNSVSNAVFWKNTFYQATDNSVSSDISLLSPVIGGSLYNFKGEYLGCDGKEEHNDCVFVGEYSIPLPVSIEVLTTPYFNNNVQNVTQSTGLKNRELNVRAILSVIRAAEAGYDNPPLDYNAWNRGRNFTEKSYEESPDDYKKHPGTLKLNEKENGSSAAGAYQFLERYYTEKDFSPKSQDKGAITKMKENRVFDIAARGDFSNFKHKASSIWTSFTARKWQNNELEKRFISYRGQEISGNSILATPIGELLNDNPQVKL